MPVSTAVHSSAVQKTDNTSLMMGARFRGLWLDNRIDDLVAVVQGVKASLDIDCAKSAADAMKFIKKRRYDIYLVDFILEGPVSRSLTVVNTILARDKNANIVFVSGYLSLEEFESTLKNLRQKIPTAAIHQIDKSDLPVPEDDGFNYFVKELLDICQNREISETSKFGSDEFEKGSLDFPDFTDFESLASSEQEAFTEAMYVRHQKKIESYFASGVTWLLFCGSWDRPAAEAKSFDEVWADDRAISYAEQTGYAPIAFSNIEVVDDFVSSSCSKGRGIDGYPIVKIERSVPAAGESRPFYVHFDTGNPVSLICDKTYTAAGWLLPKQLNFHVANIGGLKLRARKFELDGTQATDADGNVLPIVFSGLAIEKWEEYRFAVTCADDCVNTVKRNNGLCYFRTGLLGRTFQKECKALIAVDCTRGVVHFIGKQK